MAERTMGQRRYTSLEYQAGPSESYTEAVVNAVATASNRSPSPLDGDDYLTSLYESIEPDALDALLGAEYASDDPPVTVTFSYDGYRVVIDGTGSVRLTEI